MKRQSNKELQEKILGAFANTINEKISKNIKNVRAGIYPLIFDAVYNCPEMHSARSGVLKFDLGLPFDPTLEIANSVANSTNVEYGSFRVAGGAIVGGSKIRVQPTDYLNLLTLPSAFVITEKGVSLPWLDWMLNYGDNIIVANFGVKYTDGGRSGGATMSAALAPFRINPAFSGTKEDNFISRALNTRITDIEGKIWQIILS